MEAKFKGTKEIKKRHLLKIALCQKSGETSRVTLLREAQAAEQKQLEADMN